jgi:hypothetical protein
MLGTENLVSQRLSQFGGFRGGEKKHKEILPFPSATHDKKGEGFLTLFSGQWKTHT